MRGVCKNEWTDIYYTMIFDEKTHMPYYKGFTGTNIHYDEDRKEWMMSHDPDNGIMGSAVASILPLGTGALKWSLNKDICNRNTLDAFDALMTVCTVSFYKCLLNLIFQY